MLVQPEYCCILYFVYTHILLISKQPQVFLRKQFSNSTYRIFAANFTYSSTSTTEQETMKLLLLPVVLAANILITTTDSWVGKGPRYLEWALREQGHNVKVVASLHQESDARPSKNAEIVEGGEFNHLLPAHQKYLKNKRKLNRVLRNAKKGIPQDRSQLDETDSQIPIKLAKYGQDPLNPNFWYYAGLPLEALDAAFSTILPSHEAEFRPELVIVGPNEGLSFTSPNSDEEIDVENLEEMENQAEALALFAQLQGLPVITASADENEHIYYADERFFNVETDKYAEAFMVNSVSQNVRFINDKISQLVEEAMESFTPSYSLNVNFPSMNYQYSHCITSARKSPRLVQIAEVAKPKLGKIVRVPTFSKSKRDEEDASFVKLSENEITRLNKAELMRLQAILTKSSKQDLIRGVDDETVTITNEQEQKALERCQIAVAVNHITKGNSLSPEVYAVKSR